MQMALKTPVKLHDDAVYLWSQKFNCSSVGDLTPAGTEAKEKPPITGTISSRSHVNLSHALSFFVALYFSSADAHYPLRVHEECTRSKQPDKMPSDTAPATPGSKPAKKQQTGKPIRYPFWFGGSASSMAACVTHPLDLGEF